MTGKFAVIEGCDGAGKSTQIRLLKQFLGDSAGVVFTREPGGTVISEKIRDIILDSENTVMAGMTELMLYAAARAQHVAEIIRPAVESGKTVICDRFFASTVAYQGTGRGMDIKAIKTLNNLACGGIVPDLTLFLDIKPSEARERKSGRDYEDRMEKEGIDFQELVYKGYAEAEKLIGSGFVRIDVRGDKNATHEKIKAALAGYKII